MQRVWNILCMVLAGGDCDGSGDICTPRDMQRAGQFWWENCFCSQQPRHSGQTGGTCCSLVKGDRASAGREWAGEDCIRQITWTQTQALRVAVGSVVCGMKSSEFCCACYILHATSELPVAKDCQSEKKKFQAIWSQCQILCYPVISTLKPRNCFCSNFLSAVTVGLKPEDIVPIVDESRCRYVPTSQLFRSQRHT